MLVSCCHLAWLGHVWLLAVRRRLTILWSLSHLCRSGGLAALRRIALNCCAGGRPTQGKTCPTCTATGSSLGSIHLASKLEATLCRRPPSCERVGGAEYNFGIPTPQAEPSEDDLTAYKRPVRYLLFEFRETKPSDVRKARPGIWSFSRTRNGLGAGLESGLCRGWIEPSLQRPGSQH